MTSKFYLQVPGYYAFGKTVEECWANLRRISGRTRTEAKKFSHFILEFPANTDIKVDALGGWWASVKPVKLVTAFDLQEGQEQRFKELCAKGAREHEKRVVMAEEAYRRRSRGS